MINTNNIFFDEIYGFNHTLQDNFNIYKTSCKKYNRNPHIRQYSWWMEKICLEYALNGGAANIMMKDIIPQQLYEYLSCLGQPLKYRLFNYDVYVFFERLPVKFPYYIFIFIKNIYYLVHSFIWNCIWYKKVLLKELKIWKSMKKNGCYAGPDPRIKYKNALKYIPIIKK
jgi:hypothetical protein